MTGIGFALTIEGIQSAGVQAVAKHLVGNEQETQRKPTVSSNGTKIDSISSNIDDRTLHEVYGWPFANAIQSGVSAVMCSYNRANGSYACQNSKLINGFVKEELSFQGYVLSDWAATHSGVASVLAGLDMVSWFSPWIYSTIVMHNRTCLGGYQINSPTHPTSLKTRPMQFKTGRFRNLALMIWQSESLHHTSI